MLFRSFSNNVRSVLTAVESGNVELGIVYATDAALSRQVKVLTTVPEEFHLPIVYPIAIVDNSAQFAAAQRFIDFLTTETAQTMFTRSEERRGGKEGRTRWSPYH